MVFEPVPVERPALQFGHGVAPVAEHVSRLAELLQRRGGRRAARLERVGLAAHRPPRYGAPLAGAVQPDARQEPVRKGCHVGEGEATFALRGRPPAEGQHPGQAAVALPVDRPEEQGRAVDRLDRGADEEFEPHRLCRDVGADHPGERGPVGDGEGRVPELERPRHQFVGVRGPFEEREVSPTVQLGIRDLRPGSRGPRRTKVGKRFLEARWIGHGTNRVRRGPTSNPMISRKPRAGTNRRPPGNGIPRTVRRRQSRPRSSRGGRRRRATSRLFDPLGPQDRAMIRSRRSH